MKRIELLIIDGQNDFCEPHGALFVKGAPEDCRRLADFIRRNIDVIDGITVTLDSHHLYDIAHPLYWVNGRGENPVPFTVITADDVKSGKWMTAREDDRTHGLEYVRQLEARGRYRLCIWPPHCLIGSWGTQLQGDIFSAVTDWEKKHRRAAVKVFKGTNPATEHYGAFEAEVPLEEDPGSAMRMDLIESLDKADEILLAGEALDYCVANTVRQLAGSLPSEKMDKIVLLEDCTSSVDPSSGMSEGFLYEMESRGMRFVKSADCI